MTLRVCLVCIIVWDVSDVFACGAQEGFDWREFEGEDDEYADMRDDGEDDDIPYDPLLDDMQKGMAFVYFSLHVFILFLCVFVLVFVFGGESCV